MWRERNETPADLERELAASEKISTVWGVKCLKLGEVKYRVDWAIFDGQSLCAWGEYRYRFVKRLQYKTFMLAADKWHHLKWLSEMSGLPSLMFVEWMDDGLFYINCAEVDSSHVDYLHGGNLHRGQNGDIEPMVHLPVDLFSKV